MRISSFKNGIRFSAVIQPRASKNEVAGIYKDALKIRLTSPPVDGAANKACMRFISDWLDVSLSAIRIVQGFSSKNKTIEVEGLAEEKFHEILKTKNIHQ